MHKWLWLLYAPALLAQTDLTAVLARLERLEAENARLRGEVATLRTRVDQLAGPAAAPPAANEPTLPERVEIAERRITEQASTKVEAANRFPLTLTGMALFNMFSNTRGAGGVDTPNQASANAVRGAGGISFRQSIVGLKFDGPKTVFGGRISGSVYGDFWDGTTEGTAGINFRIRTADLALDWARRGITIGYLKPLISPWNPTSLATSGVTPLTSSGNLWRWQPQIRYEERVGVFRLQAALMQTSEQSGGALVQTTQLRRPSLELRGAVHRERAEIGVGGHVSTSHVGAYSVPSRIVSVDWRVRPWQPLELTGFLFRGENVHHLGALRQSFQVLPDGRITGVHSLGGWAQAAVTLTPRWTVNLFGGIHDDRNRDLAAGQNGRNRAGGANLMYRLAPNVLVSLEALQIRSLFLGTGERRVNRYDLSLAYLF